MIDGTEGNFSELVGEGTVLVDYFATWCGPCRMLAPTLQKLEDDHDLKVVKVNIDEQPELAKRFRIMSIPTLLLFKDGQVARTVIGVKPQAELEKEFNLT
jgi:thioredoxin 1